MALESITPLVSAQPTGRYVGSAGVLAVGEILRLSLAGAEGEDLLATTPDGQPLRLAGLGRLAATLAPGDILQVRVLATAPQLQLALLNPPKQPHAKPAGLAGDEESAAMRPDQLASRQLARLLPDAAALAMTWQTRLLAHLKARADQRGQRPVLGLPLALLGAGTAAALSRETPPAAADPEDWIFFAHAWAGLPVTLRLLEGKAKKTPAGQRRRGTATLRLEFDLPGLGSVTVQLELAAGGIDLALFFASREALRRVRDALPAIASALAQANLPLCCCRLELGQPGAATDWAGPDQATPSAALPLPLFRAAAEIMLVLAKLAGLSPGSR